MFPRNIFNVLMDPEPAPAGGGGGGGAGSGSGAVAAPPSPSPSSPTPASPTPPAGSPSPREAAVAAMRATMDSIMPPVAGQPVRMGDPAPQPPTSSTSPSAAAPTPQGTPPSQASQAQEASPAALSTPPSPTPAPPADEDFALPDLGAVGEEPPPPSTEPAPAPAPGEPAPAATEPTPPSLPPDLLALVTDPDAPVEGTASSSELRDHANKIRAAFLASNQGRQLLGHARAMRELETELGAPPTPESIRSWYDSHSRYTDLTLQLESGDPAQTTAAFSALLTTADPLDPAQTILRPGVESFLSTYAGNVFSLAQAANRLDLYHTAAKPFHAAKFAAILNHIREAYPGGEPDTPAQKSREVMVYALKKLAPLYGQRVTDEDFTVRPADPSARLADENRRLREQLHTRDTTAATAEWDSFTTHIGSLTAPRLDRYVDAALSFCRDRYEAPVYSAFRTTFRDACLNALASNPNYVREADLLLNRAQQTGAYRNGSSEQIARQVAQIQDRYLRPIVEQHRTQLVSNLRGGSPPASPSGGSATSSSAAGSPATAPNGSPSSLTPAQQQALRNSAQHPGSPGLAHPTANGGGMVPSPAPFVVNPADPVGSLTEHILRNAPGGAAGR